MKKSASVIFLVALFEFLASLFIVYYHDWDVSSWLYLGSRLRFNELLYEVDFETKFPLVQFIFFIPFTLGGVGSWRIMNFLLATALTFISYHRIFKSENSNFLGRSFQDSRALFSTATFLVLAFALPGGQSGQLEILGSSLFLIALSLYFNAVSSPRINFLLIGIVLGFSSQVRPNFLFLIPAFFLRNRLNQYTSTESIAMRASALVCGLALSFLPTVAIYTIKGKFSALREGFMTLLSIGAENNNLNFLYYQIRDNNTSSFYLLLYLCIFAMMYNYINRSKFGHSDFQVLIFKISFLAILLLQLSIFSIHYFTHNSIMFASILPLMISGQFSSNCFRVPFLNSIDCKKVSALLILTCLPLALLNLTSSNSIVTSVAQSLSINERNFDRKLLRYLETVQNNGQTFYVVDNPIYHSVLMESRIGDGHPAILRERLEGTIHIGFSRIGILSKTTSSNTCSIFNHFNKSFIVYDKGSSLGRKVSECLEKNNSRYTYTQVNERSLPKFVILKRN